MRADRRSAYNSVFNAQSFEDALAYEWDYSKDIILKESAKGRLWFIQM